MPKCFVYVLQSEVDGTLYVGTSSRLQRRIREHNAGHCQATKAKRPSRLTHKEEYADHESARKREEYLKSGRGRGWLRNKLDVESPPA